MCPEGTPESRDFELSLELIKLHSDHIKTTSEGMANFRARIGLSVFLGPYVVLGSYLIGTKGMSLNSDLEEGIMDFMPWPLVVFLMYMGCAWLGAAAEIFACNVSNDWRLRIARLIPNNDCDEEFGYLQPKPSARRNRLIVLYYTLAFSVIGFLFIATIMIMLKMPPPPK